MKAIHKLALVAVMLTAALVMSGCGGTATKGSQAAADTNSVGAIKKAGKIRVGIAIDPPLAIRTPTGAWTSFTPEIVNQFAESLGVKVQFVNLTFNTIIAALQSGQIDMIGVDLANTPERAKAVDFTNPFLYFGSGWIVREGAYANWEELNSSKVRVSVLANTSDDEIVKKYLPKAKVDRLTQSSYADLAARLAAGRTDAIGAHTLVAPAILAQFPGTVMLPDVAKGLDSLPTSFAVRKGDNALRDAINAFLEKKTADGTLPQLLQKVLAEQSVTQ
ncbi:polar amino acid transport system substrate-binding protein [Marmoricola sp. URHA0025 HA25]